MGERTTVAVAGRELESNGRRRRLTAAAECERGGERPAAVDNGGLAR